MKNTNLKSSAVNLTELNKVMKNVNLNDIPNEIGSRGEGPHAGRLVSYLPAWAKEDGLKPAMVHNRYKTIKVYNSMGLMEEKLVFDGFTMYASLGKDKFGREIIDTLVFFDPKHDAMTFEDAIKNIADNAKAKQNPDGPARKLHAIAIENGFENPLDMIQGGVDEATGEVLKINYAQKLTTVSSPDGYKYKRRTCMSLSMCESLESNKKEQPKTANTYADYRRRSSANNTAQHKRDAFNKSWGV